MDNRKLHYNGGLTSDIIVIKETKRYLTFRATRTTFKYRMDKTTGEIQDGTYHKTIPGLYIG